MFVRKVVPEGQTLELSSVMWGEASGAPPGGREGTLGKRPCVDGPEPAVLGGGAQPWGLLRALLEPFVLKGLRGLASLFLGTKIIRFTF